MWFTKGLVMEQPIGDIPANWLRGAKTSRARPICPYLGFLFLCYSDPCYAVDQAKIAPSTAAAATNSSP